VQFGSIWKKRWAQGVLLIVFWTIPAIFFSSQLYFMYSRSPKVTWGTALTEELNYCYLWAVFTPIILWLVRRFRIEGKFRFRNTLIHVLASLILSILQRGIHIALACMVFNHRPITMDMVVTAIYSNFDYGILIYWVLLLVDHAVLYYQKFREGELIALRLESQLVSAQLQALKMQLHPHFLFNTLHSISALIHKDIDAADRMIARLGDFLRLTLDNVSTQEVTLEKELQFLTGYLEIERIRFHDRLKINFEIDPNTLDLYVPNLILQPIVENAIRHGIAPRNEPGELWIQSSLVGSSLQLRVRDNGHGLKEGDQPKHEGIGISNTRSRMQQLYGDQARLEFANVRGGFTVILQLPIVKRPERSLEDSGLLISLRNKSGDTLKGDDYDPARLTTSFDRG
jgi:two-component system, LytTR family, sensor kinase